MKKTFTCNNTFEELTIDIDELVKDYEKNLVDGISLNVEDYVDDLCCNANWYYWDNSEEIQTEICNAMKQQLADGNK